MPAATAPMPGKSVGDRADRKARRHGLEPRRDRCPEERSQQERGTEEAAAHAGAHCEGGSRDFGDQEQHQRLH